MKYRFWELEIDGPDKTGKDLICRYLCELSGWRFSINVRGIISQMVYAKKFDREFEYDTNEFSKDKVLILLTAEPEDLKIRCKMTNEPMYDFERDAKLFDEAVQELSEKYRIMTFDTSHSSPYDIAKRILNRIDKLEEYAQNGKISQWL